MSFHDVVLPPGLQYASAFGAGFSTIVQETASGHEVRIARQSQSRHRLRLVKALQTSAEAKVLKSFALERRGALHSFKVTDASDFTTNPDGEGTHSGLDVILGTGNGTATTFQLLKVYGTVNPYVRTVTLPVAGTVLVTLDSTPTTLFTVDGTGRVTLNSAPANGVVVAAGCQFYVPVRFGLTFDQWAGLQADAFNTWSLVDLDVVEVLDEVQNPERLDPNGGRDYGAVSASFRVAYNDGKFHHMAPSAAISVFLPPSAGIPGGSGIFRFSNATGSAGSIQVRDDAGNTVGAAIAAGNVRDVDLAINGSGGATWVLA